MNKWLITPYVGMGALRFGMQEKKILHILGNEIEKFRRGNSSTDTILYPAIGVFLDFDSNGKLIFIESCSPCKPLFENVEMLGQPLSKVVDAFCALGGKPTKVNAGCIFDDFGIAFYSPYDNVESVAVYIKNYYHSLGSE